MKRIFPTVCAGAIAAFATAQTVVTSNQATGDTVVGPASSVPIASAPGWIYNNVTAGSTVGINAAYARSGNGSVSFTTVNGGGKADVEFYNRNAAGTNYASMGRLDQITSLGYDWFRNGVSTTSGILSPAMRVIFDADGDFGTTDDRGYLVYEHCYTFGGDAPKNVWTTENMLTGNVWQRKFSGPSEQRTIAKYDYKISDWTAGAHYGASLDLRNAVVYGLSFGVGSGWSGTFAGAIDNVQIGFGGNAPKTYNFERSATQAVPEPVSLVALGIGVLALLRRRLRRS